MLLVYVMKHPFYLLLFFTLILSTSLAQPITNVEAIQKDNTVEITYNLEGDCPANISVYYCENDCIEFKGPLKNVHGDVGKNILPGKRKITWNVLQDQDILVGNNIIFRVKAIRLYGMFTDERDGKIYKTIKIGNQTWMAENLAYKPNKYFYRSYNKDSLNALIYGYMYNWNGALKLCPKGWHLPSKDDFTLLVQSVESYGTNPSIELLQDGESGFSALLGGYVDNYGKYFEINISSNFWTSTGDIGSYYACCFNIEKYRANLGEMDKWVGLYIRCIKD